MDSSYDEIRNRNVDIVRPACEIETGQSADGEKPDQPYRVEHRRVEGYAAAVEGRRPVEHLDRRRHRDDEAHEGEDDPGEDRDPRREHMMSPDEEADDGDGDHGKGHTPVAEDRPAREAGNELARNAHRRQDHDVDGGMRVE